MGYDDLRKEHDPTGALKNVPDDEFLAYVADHDGKAGATPPQAGAGTPEVKRPREAPAMLQAAGGLAKAGFTEMGDFGKALVNAPVDLAKSFINIPRGLIVDPARQVIEGNRKATPEEEQRTQSGLGGLVGIVLPGPAGKLVSRLGAGPRLATSLAFGAGGAADAAISSGGKPNETIAGGTLAALMGALTHGAHDAGKSAVLGIEAPKPHVTAPPVAEGVSEHVRMSETPPNKAGETLRAVKNIVMGYHHPFPLLAGKKFATGESMSDAFVRGLQGIQDAGDRAHVANSTFWKSQLTGKGRIAPEQMELVRQHVTAASILDDFQHGKKLPEGYTPQQLEKDYIETAIALSENPEAQAAVPAMRQRYDAFHAELEKRGIGTGYRKSYSPLRNVQRADRFVPQTDEARRAGRTPSFMKERGKAGAERSYDVPRLMGDYEEQFNKKIAEDDLITKIQNDPTVNLAATEEGRAHLRKYGIPDTHVSYEAPVGMPGAGKTVAAKPSSISKEAANALLARKDLIQRAAREAEDASTASLARLERSRKAANLLEDNAKATTKSRELAERSLEIAKKKTAKMFESLTGDQRARARQARTKANAILMAREDRVARLTEREGVLIERAKKAARRVARSEAEHAKTVQTMKKKATSLMAKAEKVGQKAERLKRNKPKPVKLVIHRDVAESLSKFYPKPMGETARFFNKVGGAMARTATSLNPQNTGMNIPSDALMMLAGPAGERGTITKGIALRRAMEYPGSLASMLKQSFGGTSEKANFGRTAGAVSSTFQHEIGPTSTPSDLKAFYYPEKMSKRTAPVRLLKDLLTAPVEGLQRTRNATEAAPRLATALEAQKRGLPPEEVSRLAHESSLPYGSGTSVFAKSNPAKGLARFATYPGLADVRIVQGAIKEGSRGRYAAFLTVPPAAAALWNTQNDEYSGAEKRLKPWVKSSLHILVKKADGFDVYVIRADPFSEATNRWGIGQLSGRVVKAAKGVEPISFKDSGKEILDSYGSMYPLGPIVESIRGETKYHRKLDTPLKRAANLMPVVKLGVEAFEAEKKKPGEGAKLLLERTAGAGARRYDMKSVAGK